jgi:hypothetical protein
MHPGLVLWDRWSTLGAGINLVTHTLVETTGERRARP